MPDNTELPAYADPNSAGNSSKYLTGKACLYKCGRPAGTSWSPVLCQPCNAKRMARIDDSMSRIAENLNLMSDGP